MFNGEKYFTSYDYAVKMSYKNLETGSHEIVKLMKLRKTL